MQGSEGGGIETSGKIDEITEAQRAAFFNATRPSASSGRFSKILGHTIARAGNGLIDGSSLTEIASLMQKLATKKLTQDPENREGLEKIIQCATVLQSGGGKVNHHDSTDDVWLSRMTLIPAFSSEQAAEERTRLIALFQKHNACTSTSWEVEAIQKEKKVPVRVTVLYLLNITHKDHPVLLVNRGGDSGRIYEEYPVTIVGRNMIKIGDKVLPWDSGKEGLENLVRDFGIKQNIRIGPRDPINMKWQIYNNVY